MTQAEFLTLAGFIVVIAGAVGTFWWRISGLIQKAKDDATLRADSAGTKADLVSAQLAEYKTHVAETYVAKQGMREFREEMTASFRDLKTSISGIHDRIDRVIESDQPKRRSRNSS